MQLAVGSWQWAVGSWQLGCEPSQALAVNLPLLASASPNGQDPIALFTSILLRVADASSTVIVGVDAARGPPELRLARYPSVHRLARPESVTVKSSLRSDPDE